MDAESKAICSILSEMVIRSTGVEVVERRLDTQMNVEYDRLLSYKYWPHTVVQSNPFANPITLSKYGFYCEAKGSRPFLNLSMHGRSDRVVHYCCKKPLANWESLGHPKDALKVVGCPKCPLLINNVPIAYTLCCLSPQSHPSATDLHPIVSVSHSPHTTVVLTTSSDGTVVVWDIKTGLSLLYTWKCRTKEQESCGMISAVFLVECTAKSIPLAQEKKQMDQKEAKPEEKWVSWCTTGIEVYAGSKSPYQGVKGVVYDIISIDNISVFVEPFDSVVQMPLYHISPFRAQEGQFIKIMEGVHRGKEGLVLALTKNKVSVKVDDVDQVVQLSDNQVGSIPETLEQIKKKKKKSTLR
eukprot:TRINITY_DN19765_c0_g1_i3.p1 TRINITY_DN19765_c0_g1~~TRINITY_DN19765_c0_g1_i3.p1  ORF type:complete len:415 (-),score=59.08 TRINITY_DN19765_c0_g1_i3:10-1074(-)